MRASAMLYMRSAADAAQRSMDNIPPVQSWAHQVMLAWSSKWQCACSSTWSRCCTQPQTTLLLRGSDAAAQGRTGEDEEGGAVGDEAGLCSAMPLADGAHAVLAHAEAQVALRGESFWKSPNCFISVMLDGARSALPPQKPARAASGQSGFRPALSSWGVQTSHGAMLCDLAD